MPPVLFQNIREQRAIFHSRHEIVRWIIINVPNNTHTSFLKGNLCGPTVRRAHENQGKGRFDDVLVLRVRMCVYQRLLHQNTTEAVTDKNKRPIGMLSKGILNKEGKIPLPLLTSSLLTDKLSKKCEASTTNLSLLEPNTGLEF